MIALLYVAFEDLKLKHLDLFSGIGGFALAAQWAGIETVAFCEIDDFACKVLNKNFPGIPVHRDIRELDGSLYAGIDLITGGYPCQPFSVAGKRRGENDERHLWPEMFRIIKQARPRYVVSENVTGHITMGIDSVLDDMEREGYTCWTFVIPATGKGSPQLRYRVWIVAYASESTERDGRERRMSEGKADAWPRLVLPAGIGMDNGIPDWVDRWGAVGNAIVPQVAYEIMRCIRDV